MILYHGSKEVVEYPEIRKARFNKDFYFGFYCTNIEKQAERWAIRYRTNSKTTSVESYGLSWNGKYKANI